eukprot:206222-Amphidinium_carterae.1
MSILPERSSQQVKTLALACSGCRHGSVKFEWGYCQRNQPCTICLNDTMLGIGAQLKIELEARMKS